MTLEATRRAILAGVPSSILASRVSANPRAVGDGDSVLKAMNVATTEDADQFLPSRRVLFTPTGNGTVPRPLESVLCGTPISVVNFGAAGDGKSDDFDAILMARNHALAEGRALLFPEGNYAHRGTIELGYDSLHVVFEGRVTLYHTGSGRALSFDSGPTPALDGWMDIHFGWGNAPTLVGNSKTTDLIYVRGCHHMKLDARLRDCKAGFRCEFSVLSEFRLNGSSNEAPFRLQRPRHWVVVGRRGGAEATTACRFNLICEGSTGEGVVLTAAQHCDFWGTSEGNEGGGIHVGPESINNNFHNFFCEQNGSAPHWTIEGHNNIFLNCTGGGPSNSGNNTNIISGVRNLFLRGKISNPIDSGYYNEWRQVALSGTVSMTPNNIREKCHDGAGEEIVDLYPAPAVIEPRLIGLWEATTAAGQRAPGFYKDRSGVVHLVGALQSGSGSIFALPEGFRPGGTLWLNYYNPAVRATGVITIASGGDVRHVSGDARAVTLDNISFLAEL